ncbi:hypothetical protein HDU81_006704 [Chytriomyces hyalinus]|nr:hypothetical protein HDU81_006704 [Chytriomyces hyalinus]
MNWTGGNGQKGFGRGTRAQIHTLSTHAIKQKSKLRRAFKPGKSATTLFEKLSRSRQCQKAGTGSRDVAVLRMPVTVEERPPDQAFEREMMESQVDQESCRSLSPTPSDHRVSSPILSAGYPILRPATAVSVSAQEETLSNVDSGVLASLQSNYSRVHQAKQSTQNETLNKIRPIVSYTKSSTAAVESSVASVNSKAHLQSNESNVRRETDWKKLLWPTQANADSLVSADDDESEGKNAGTEERTRTKTPMNESDAQDWKSRILALESRVKRLESKVSI